MPRTHKPKPPVTARIIPLLDGTRTVRQIVEETGASKAQVYKVIEQYPHVKGLSKPITAQSRLPALFDGSRTYIEIAALVRCTPQTIRAYARKNNLQHLVVREKGPRIPLAPEVFKWLTEQTPEGASIWEMVSAIVTDAYHEENDKTLKEKEKP